MNQGIYALGSATIASMPYGVNGVPSPTTVRALVVGGGGGSGYGYSSQRAGGGGGGGGVVEARFIAEINATYAITVGGGGTGSTIYYGQATSGTFSTFANLIAIGGGAGGNANSSSGTNGGSGVVVLRFANSLIIRISVGLAYTSQTIGGDRLITFTAGTGTVSWS